MNSRLFLHLLLELAHDTAIGIRSRIYKINRHYKIQVPRDLEDAYKVSDLFTFMLLKNVSPMQQKKMRESWISVK